MPADDDVTVIFETVHGSRAYGLATDSSDTDLRGVFVPATLHSWVTWRSRTSWSLAGSRSTILPEHATNTEAMDALLVRIRRERFA